MHVAWEEHGDGSLHLALEYSDSEDVASSKIIVIVAILPESQDFMKVTSQLSMLESSSSP